MATDAGFWRPDCDKIIKVVINHADTPLPKHPLQPKGSMPSTKWLPCHSNPSSQVHRNQAICRLDIKFCKECPSPKALSCMGYSVHSSILVGAELRVYPVIHTGTVRDRSVIIRHFPRVCPFGTTPMRLICRFGIAPLGNGPNIRHPETSSPHTC